MFLSDETTSPRPRRLLYRLDPMPACHVRLRADGGDDLCCSSLDGLERLERTQRREGERDEDRHPQRREPAAESEHCQEPG